MPDTVAQFEKVISVCRDVFAKKLKDYGASWRILRPTSLTDQIYIKANRIRTLETKGEHRVTEGVRPELIGIVNYGIIGLIQLALGPSRGDDITEDEALALYDKYMTQTKELMYAKNHDYDEAWRLMRMTSYTDMITYQDTSYKTDRRPCRPHLGVGGYRCQLYGYDKLCIIWADKD